MTPDRSETLVGWDASTDPPRLSLRGNWTLANYAALGREIERLPASAERGTARVESDLGALDTAGAARLVELLGPDAAARLAEDEAGLSPERRAVLRSVASATRQAGEAAPKRPPFASEFLERIGESMHRFYVHTRDLLGFIGLVLEALAGWIVRPARWRVTATVAQVEQAGWDAIPIVALLTFMVGAVVAFLGASILVDFGATIYTVNLVAFAFFREFAVLLTAILLAGRTASAYTAQIGSMRANEEIDALRALGLSPVDLLVLPRVLALLVSLPILTLVGMASGIFGGALVAWMKLDISLTMFVTIVQQDIPLRHFILGIAKAPLFAFVIAVIGCLEGFKVEGSAQSVGEHTTSSVVQAIFVVILLDAFAALFFTEMGW